MSDDQDRCEWPIGDCKFSARIRELEAQVSALSPAPVTVSEAARVLLDQPYKKMTKAFDAMDSKEGEGSDRILAAALRAIQENDDE